MSHETDCESHCRPRPSRAARESLKASFRILVGDHLWNEGELWAAIRTELDELVESGEFCALADEEGGAICRSFHGPFAAAEARRAIRAYFHEGVVNTREDLYCHLKQGGTAANAYTVMKVIDAMLAAGELRDRNGMLGGVRVSEGDASPSAVRSAEGDPADDDQPF
jgi:hypothetical protein